MFADPSGDPRQEGGFYRECLLASVEESQCALARFQGKGPCASLGDTCRGWDLQKFAFEDVQVFDKSG